MMDLDLFFEEKQIPYTQWMIEYDGEKNFIDSDCIIECILKTKGIERKKIASVLSALDFKNASIIDYLHFLAKCLVEDNKRSRDSNSKQYGY